MIRFLLFFSLVSTSLVAQKPRAGFFADSVLVGKEIKLYVSFHHSSKSDIVFPDSTFDFSPFKYISTEYFETQTINGKSLDSVIYTLVSYELKPVLAIQPFIKNLNSGEKIFADSAKVILSSQITEANLLNPAPEKTMEFFTVKKELNIPKLTYYIMGLLLLGFVVIYFFGDWFGKRFKVWKLDQQHRRFIGEFRKMAQSPKESQNIQKAVTAWKTYIEHLNADPISTMSTSEIGVLYENERLESALKMFDSAIFGGVISDQIPFAYHILQDFSIKKYRDVRKSTS